MSSLLFVWRAKARRFAFRLWLTSLALMVASTELQAQAQRVDASTWSAERAAQVQQAAELRELHGRQYSDPRERALAEREYLRRTTGLGESPHHAEADAELRDMQRLQQRIASIEQRLRIARERGEHESAAREIEQESRAGSTVSMRLRAPQSGSPTGGYAYLIRADRSIGYVTIDAAGQIAVPLPTGAPFSLIVIPAGDFAIEVVEGLKVAVGGEILLGDAVQVPFATSVDDGSTYAGHYRVSLSPSNSFVNVGVEAPVGSDAAGRRFLLLAPAQTYGLTISVDAPFLVQSSPAFVAAVDSDIPLALQRGFRLQVDLRDPDGLLAGCSISGESSATPSMRVDGVANYMSQSRLEQLPGTVRAVLGVPRGVPVDIRADFWAGGNACPIQQERLNSLRFTEDTVLPINLKRQPMPVLNVVDQSGAAVPWSFAMFVETTAPYHSIYVPSDQASAYGLRADQEYEVQLYGPNSERLSAERVRVRARAGQFPVTVQVYPSARLRVSMPAPQGVYAGGVLEAYRNGALVSAMHVGANWPSNFDLPAGDYEFRLFGVTGSVFAGDQRYRLLLKPRWISHSVGAGDQELVIPLVLPQAGVRLDLSEFWAGVHLTAYQAGVPVAAMHLYTYDRWILTDLAELDVQLRGEGLDDARAVWTPTDARPLVDVSSLQSAMTYLEGTLRDAEGQPLAENYLVLSTDVEHDPRAYGTDAAGRFRIPKQRGARVWVRAPVGGRSVGTLIELGAPGADSQMDVNLAAVDFNPIDYERRDAQLIYGTGDRSFRVVFLAEGYSGLRESFTDTNGNGVWDGWLFLDANGDGLFQFGEHFQRYGDIQTPLEPNTDISAGNEPFQDLNGDGYPSISDPQVFELNVRDYVRSLLGTPEIRDGIEFDAYVVLVDSAQAGMDIEGAGGQLLLQRNTAFDARFEYSRGLLSVDYPKVMQFLRTKLERWNLQVVMINQPLRMGRANAFILANGGIGASSPNDLVAGHEFGHNPGGLADEYVEFSGTLPYALSPDYGNVADWPLDVLSPWADLLDPREDVPLSLPNSYGTGLYVGAHYYPGGAYRPSATSRMSNNVPHFNRPSQRAMAKKFCLAMLTREEITAPLPPQPVGYVFSGGFEEPSGPSYDVFTPDCPR
jgi:hypothetical protein